MSDRLRIITPFPRFEVVDGFPNNSTTHPLSLPLASLDIWMKWAWRVKNWTSTISAASFSPPSVTGQLTGRAIPFGNGTPTDEEDVVRIQTYNFNGDGTAYSQWGGGFGHEAGPPSGSASIEFQIHTSEDGWASGQIYPVRWQSGTSRIALSFYYSIRGSVETVGDVWLSTNYEEATYASISTGNPIIESTLVVDPLGYNIYVPVFGYDQVGLSLSLGPASTGAYWSYGGIYNTDTGAVNPGQSVYQNTVNP